MRLASGLLASALSLSLGILACSSFGAADDPGSEVEGGVDATAGFDAGGFVIVDNQSGATELVADNDHVVWSFSGGLRAATPTAQATPVDVSGRNAKSLQLDGDRVYFASDDAVYYADINGDMLDSGARSITPQGSGLPVLASRSLASAITFAKDRHLYWCPGPSCGATSPKNLDLGAVANVFGGERNGDFLWLTVGDDLRSFETTGFTQQAQFSVDGGVRAFAIDEIKAFYAPNEGDVILTRDRRSATDPPTPFATVDGGHPWAFALDATNLYVAVLDAGTVLQVNKQTGTVTTIASGLHEPRSLAQTDTRLLVLADGAIFSYAKGP